MNIPKINLSILKFIYLIFVVTLNACSSETQSYQSASQPISTIMNNELRTIKIKSKTLPVEELSITMPACFYVGLKDNQEYVNSLALSFPLAAFSDNSQHLYNCAQINEPKTQVLIEPMYPISRENKNLEKNHIFADYERFGIQFISAHNNLKLYKVSPDEFGIFIPKDINNKENFVIDFIPYDSKSPDSKYPHTIKVTTEFNGKFWIKYKIYTSYIINNKKNPLFSDNLITESGNEPVLKDLDLINGFISNNNMILNFFHEKSNIE